MIIVIGVLARYLVIVIVLCKKIKIKLEPLNKGQAWGRPFWPL